MNRTSMHALNKEFTYAEVKNVNVKKVAASVHHNSTTPISLTCENNAQETYSKKK